MREEPNINIWRVLRLHAKRSCLQQEFAMFLASWQEEGMRLSDVLNAIAQYARSESNKVSGEKQSWDAIALYLELASIEAEMPEHELP